MKWSLILLLGYTMAANAIVMRHDVENEKYISFAKDNLSVVTFYGDYKGKKIVEGTGTLISKNWVITAAHVANYLVTDGEVRFQDSTYKIQSVVKHPKWQDKQFPYDIALVQLQSPVLNGKPATLYGNDDELNKTVTFIGRGDFGTGKNGIIGADDKLRAAENVVSDVDGQWLKFKFNSGMNALPLEGISGPGDSGGPALFETNNTQYILGVSSWQNAEPTKWQEAKYGVIENYARISYFKGWIEKTMTQHASIRPIKHKLYPE